MLISGIGSGIGGGIGEMHNKTGGYAGAGRELHKKRKFTRFRADLSSGMQINRRV